MPEEPHQSAVDPSQPPIRKEFDAAPKAEEISENSGENWEPSPKMRYLEAYQYIFRHPEWGSTVLQLVVCSLIPVLNQIILVGYQFEVIEDRLLKKGPLYPKFDFGKFTDYLMRGLWPFIVNLIISFVITPIILVFNFIMMAGIVAGEQSADRETGVLIIGGSVALYIAAVIFISLLMMFLLIPFILRAGLSQDFSETFKIRWVFRFIKKMWLEQVLVSLFLAISGAIVGMVGFLLCCIGVLPAGVIIMLAQAHLYLQLYRLFLARGGEPIPLKSTQDAAAPFIS